MPDQKESAPIPAAFSLAGCSPFGASPDGLRFEILLDGEPTEGTDASPPFLVLDDSDPYRRVILCRVADGAGNTVRLLSVALFSDTSGAGADGGLVPGETNRSLEDRWRREIEVAGKLYSMSSASAEMFHLAPGQMREGIYWWPPLLYSPESGRFLSPGCPTCGGRLAVCRDESLLVSGGLPGYASSLYRFLYCSKCAQEGEPVFFAHKITDELKAKGVRGPESVALLEVVPLSDPGENPDSGEEINAGSTAIPLNFYDSPVLCTPLAALDYGELADLIGGLAWSEFNSRRRLPITPDGRPGAVEEEFASGPRTLFYGADASGRDALEILRLKLTLFSQTCRAVYDLRRLGDMPHLRLCPQSARFEIPPLGEGLPSLWNFRVRLTNLGHARPLSTGLSEDPLIYMPPPDREPLYMPPHARSGDLWQPRTGELVVQEIEADSLVALLRDENAAFPPFGARDLVRVELALPGTGNRISLWGSIEETERSGSSSLSIRTALQHLEKADVQSIKKLKGVSVRGARYALFPRLDVPYDIHALGMLFFRSLLVNDSQDAASVEIALDDLRRLLSRAAAQAGESFASTASEQAAKWLSSSEHAPVFERVNVFYQRADRMEDRPNAIPEELWRQCMFLGLRMTVFIRGFGFCQGLGDYDRHFPAARMEPVLTETARLCSRIDALLFDLHERNMEIHAAITEIAASLGIEE